MALFAGQDRTGSAVSFAGDGSASGFVLKVAVATATPTALGHQSGTANTTARTLATATGAAVPTGSTHVRIDVNSGGDDFCYRLDGSTTTVDSVGEVIPAGQAGEISLADFSQMIVRTSGTGTATFRASFRKYV